jgi:hypothetical protein
MLRFQIRKTYRNLPDDLKDLWKEVIEGGMGEGYVENGL